MINRDGVIKPEELAEDLVFELEKTHAKLEEALIQIDHLQEQWQNLKTRYACLIDDYDDLSEKWIASKNKCKELQIELDKLKQNDSIYEITDHSNQVELELFDDSEVVQDTPKENGELSSKPLLSPLSDRVDLIYSISYSD